MTGLALAPAPGLHAGIPLDRYLAIDAASSSRLWALTHESPWHARFGYRAPTPAMALGSLLHALVLEPDTVPRRFYRFDGDRRSNAKKTEWEGAEAAGLEVVRADAWDEAHEQAGQIRAVVAPLLARVHAHEATMIWDEGGLACKARPDAILADGLLDLKRSRSGHPRAFVAACARYGFHFQAAWYRRGARKLGLPHARWRWVVAEVGGPVTVYEAQGPDLDRIEMEVERALGRYRACLSTDSWPGYEGGPLDLSALALVEGGDVQFEGLALEDEGE